MNNNLIHRSEILAQKRFLNFLVADTTPDVYRISDLHSYTMYTMYTLLHSQTNLTEALAGFDSITTKTQYAVLPGFSYSQGVDVI